MDWASRNSARKVPRLDDKRDPDARFLKTEALGRFECRVAGPVTEHGTVQQAGSRRARGCATFDARSDIYSLGALLRFLLTGHPEIPSIRWTPLRIIAGGFARRRQKGRAGAIPAFRVALDV